MSNRDAIVAEIPRLRRYARALPGTADTADDLVQETLQRALEKWRLWQRERDLRPWLFSIMHNLHVDGRRRDQRIDFRDDDDLPLPVQRASQTDALELRDLERALALLPLDQREVLLLVGLEELSYGEVARALNIPQGTVMSRLSRARARLKAILAEEAAPHLKVVST
ncbi:MAG: sigma-70 family RNA polymerase sigma factor [Betaproteobacteria bacterium]|nr:sigma-70 family RNA polymerase sigma factor [Betaproteobacteria bacterium]